MPLEPPPRVTRFIAARQIQRDLFIAFLALVSVGIGIVELTNPQPGFTVLDAVDLAIVGVFIVDFVTHARASGNWWRYVRRHWWEVPSLVPVTGGVIEAFGGYAVVRGVRLVRLVRVIRLIRVVGMAARVKRVRRYVRRVVTRAQVMTLAWSGTILVSLGAFAGYVAEGGANPRLTTLGDAYWWALNLFTTVAYLDFQPATRAGRWIASVLMVSGVAFIGIFTASLANAILKEPGADEETEEMAEEGDAVLE